MITLAQHSSISQNAISDDWCVRADGISKRYCRNLRQSWHYGAREIITELTCGSRKDPQLRPGEFWSLDDVSFEIARGQSVALIGSNGAGKTTLLKLIGGLVCPDKGQMQVTGRVVPLMALGVGFRPALTGRENISANMALYGLNAAQIRASFDDVIAFADLGEFIDSPVQTYSSGMFMRLAFACAVHTQPDLLLVDEVMAVGDFRFQKKCFEKLAELKAGGTSFVITSHFSSALAQVCDQAIHLEGGKLIAWGAAAAIIGNYQDQGGSAGPAIVIPPMFAASSTVSPDNPLLAELEIPALPSQMNLPSTPSSPTPGNFADFKALTQPNAGFQNFNWQFTKPKIEVWHDAPIESERFTTYGATIELPDSSRQKLWYKVPTQFTSFVTASADPFLVGSIFLAMERSADLVVHSRVSPSLLRNLIDFQNTWFSWCPDKYGRGEIAADNELETEPANPAGQAICAFSSGLDSLFTVYRHRFVPIGRQKREIAAALLIQGFDISNQDNDAFTRLTNRSQNVLKTADIPLITISTNFKEINPLWIHTHGAGLVSSLMLFQKQFTEGVIAATYSYNQLLLPWGSNPITDPYLSSSAFGLTHDAAHWSRMAKLQAVANWPEAYDSISVCYSNTRRDENCCRCGKCIMTMLLASINQLNAPKSFPHPLTAELLLSLRNMEEFELFGLDEMIPLVRMSSLPRSIVAAFERCIKFNQRRTALEQLNSKTGWTPIGKVIQRLHKHAGIHLP